MRVVNVLRAIVGLLVAVSLGWAVGCWALDRPRLAPIGLAIVLGGYAVALAIEFAWLRRHHGEATPPPLRRLLRAWAVETALGPWVFGWRQPFRRGAAPDVETGHANTRGVLLVHGYFCNRGIWSFWLRHCRASGTPCVAVDLDPAFAPVRAYAATLDAAVRRLTERCGGRPPVIVAHSMGGIAVRAWLAEGGAHAHRRVHRVITIGSPHRGTWLARFATTPNGRDMRIGSALLHKLDVEESAERRRAFTCFWSDCDNVVFPSAHATLAGADNRKIVGWAHVHLVQHPAILAAALEAATEEADQTS